MLAHVVLVVKDAKARENLIGCRGSHLLCRLREFETGGCLNEDLVKASP